ncbi:hypothetical protein BT69DRAFT_1304004 [Atractiella rhizophila]|nr:hypothetical protein BT69DRAFT_1304004 [Atractiella rhizophila]
MCFPINIIIFGHQSLSPSLRFLQSGQCRLKDPAEVVEIYDPVPNTKRSELLLKSTVLSHDPKPNPPPPSSQAAILVPKTWSELKGIKKKTALLLILLEIMAGDAIPQAFVKKTKKVGEFHDYIALQGQELVVKDDDHQDCPLRRKTTKNEEPPSLPMPSYEELMGCDDAHLKDFIVKLSWMELAEWEEEGSAAVFPDSLNQLNNTHFIIKFRLSPQFKGNISSNIVTMSDYK